jgi:hydrogenase maturation factor
MKFAPGKLPCGILDRLLKKYTFNPQKNSQSRVLIGPQIGQDCAVVDLGSKYLVSKTDPVTFATDAIGYYAVSINANDIATSGANPQWFQATILLPEEKTDEVLVENIFRDIGNACDNLGIAWIGGHTEITFGLDRPIVIGSMFGEVEKDQLITSMGGKSGDAIIITKGIVIEGTAIIAKEREADLIARGINQDLIERGKALLFHPGLSVVKEARLLAQNFPIHSMHDPTEGGLAMGLVELAKNSQCGFVIEESLIPFNADSLILCQMYGLDPLRTITSGTLIATLDAEYASKAIELLQKEGIEAAYIGKLTANPNEYNIKTKDGQIFPIKYSEKDEITKIFE